MGYKVIVNEYSNLQGLNSTKVLVVENTNIGTAAYNEAKQAAVAAANSAAQAQATLANVVMKSGDTMTGNLTLKDLNATGSVTSSNNAGVINYSGDYGQRMIMTGSNGYFQSGKKDQNPGDQKLILSGWLGTPLSYCTSLMKDGVNPQVKWGSLHYDIYHKGNRPTALETSSMGVYSTVPESDCDKALNDGTYMVSSGVINLPAGVTAQGCKLLVNKFDDNSVSQTLFSHADDRIFSRRRRGGIWQSWFELYSSSSKQPVGGSGLGVGECPEATTVTGGIRDFNLIKTNGTYTVQGDWLNGTNNDQNVANGHTGVVNVYQRYWDNMTTQEYITSHTVAGAKVTRTWIRSLNSGEWGEWYTGGGHENINTYRYGILRHNVAGTDDGNAPYISLTKEHFRPTVTANSSYTVGEVSFRAGSQNRYDPHSAFSMARVLGRVYNTSTPDSYEGELYLSSRFKDVTGSNPDTSILIMNRDYGARFTSDSKHVYIKSGEVNADGRMTAVDFIKTSDIRLKSDIKTIDSCLDRVNAITPYTYNKVGIEGREAGVMAQDVLKALPEVVKDVKVDVDGESKDMLGISDAGLNALSIGAINELHELVKSQQAQIEELKRLIDR